MLLPLTGRASRDMTSRDEKGGRVVVALSRPIKQRRTCRAREALYIYRQVLGNKERGETSDGMAIRVSRAAANGWMDGTRMSEEEEEERPEQFKEEEEEEEAANGWKGGREEEAERYMQLS